MQASSNTLILPLLSLGLLIRWLPFFFVAVLERYKLAIALARKCQS